MSQLKYWLNLALLVSLPAGCHAQVGPSTRPAEARVFSNPIKAKGADPWMQYVDGWYYLSTTEGRDVRLRRAHRLADIDGAADTVVWRDTTPGRNGHFWAPEFHRLDNGAGQMRWYLYYTASGPEEPSHRVFVCESAGDDVRGPYTFKAQLKTDAADKYYAIDGTVFEGPDHTLYAAWCGRPSDTGQGLFLSKMANPWTLEGDRISLKADGFGCPVVREGPEMLKHGGKLFLVYSMCPASTPDYRLGMLIADEKADLMEPASWKQHPKVVFARNDAAGVYGPGHNYFFKSPDGTEDWIVYHAKSGTKETYADRSTRAQKFGWDADGLPVFGSPVAEGAKVAVPRGE